MPANTSISTERELDTEELIALSRQTLKRIDTLLERLRGDVEPDHDVNEKRDATQSQK